jgi:3-hydroxyacyl-[acyl-carrier-protein] dehydratase
MPPVTFIDPTQIDYGNLIADAEAIEAINPHRHGMRMIDGIVYLDTAVQLIAGYKDCRDDEFWVHGHMPGYPIFPGVLMIEAAAQLACYYTKAYSIFRDTLLGLGGVEDARFRGPVRPGDRLLIIGKGIKIDRRKTEFAVQGYVGSTMVFNLTVFGIPIPGQEQLLHRMVACASGVGG